MQRTSDAQKQKCLAVFRPTWPTAALFQMREIVDALHSADQFKNVQLSVHLLDGMIGNLKRAVQGEELQGDISEVFPEALKLTLEAKAFLEAGNLEAARLASRQALERFPETFDGAVECPLCGLRVLAATGHYGGRFRCETRCGIFRTGWFVRDLHSTDRAALTAATRQYWEKQKPRYLQINEDNVQELIRKHKVSITDYRLNLLLMHLARAGRGVSSKFDPELDWPVADASSPSEVKLYIEDLIEKKLLLAKWDLTSAYDCVVLAQGWQRIETVQVPAGQSGRCFVVMSFGSAMDEPYENGIKRALRDTGYEVRCMKEITTNQGITDRILEEIQKAQFVVADFTEHRAGCYFEAGYAQGIGREVISSCRDTDFSNLHFDRRHLGHVKWSDPEDLCRKLTKAIADTVGVRNRNA